MKNAIKRGVHLKSTQSSAQIKKYNFLINLQQQEKIGGDGGCDDCGGGGAASVN